jgi:hypothetical protein
MQINVYYDPAKDKYRVSLVDPARLWLVVEQYWYRSPINLGDKINTFLEAGHLLDQASYDAAMQAALDT